MCLAGIRHSRTPRLLHVIPKRTKGFTRHPEANQRFYTSSRTKPKARVRDLPVCYNPFLARGFLASLTSPLWGSCAARSDAAGGHGFCPQWQKPQFATRAHHTVVMRITRGSPPKGEPLRAPLCTGGDIRTKISPQAKPRFCAAWSDLTTLPSDAYASSTSPIGLPQKNAVFLWDFRRGGKNRELSITPQGTSHRSAAVPNLPTPRLLRKGVAARSYECCQMRAAEKPRGQAQPCPRGVPPLTEILFVSSKRIS